MSLLGFPLPSSQPLQKEAARNKPVLILVCWFPFFSLKLVEVSAISLCSATRSDLKRKRTNCMLGTVCDITAIATELSCSPQPFICWPNYSCGCSGRNIPLYHSLPHGTCLIKSARKVELIFFTDRCVFMNLIKRLATNNLKWELKTVSKVTLSKHTKYNIFWSLAVARFYLLFHL